MCVYVPLFNFLANVYHQEFKTGLINAIIRNFVSLVHRAFNDAWKLTAGSNV